MLMYLDHRQSWLVYGYSLLILVILVLFWLSGTGQIWCFRPFWWCFVDFPNDPFDWNWSYLDFLGFIWRTYGRKYRGGRRHISDALRRILSCFIYSCSSSGSYNLQFSSSYQPGNTMCSFPWLLHVWNMHTVLLFFILFWIHLRKLFSGTVAVIWLICGNRVALIRLQ